MDCTITEETFDWFAARWEDRADGLRWDTLFVLPPWLRAWRQVFAPEDRACFFAGWQDGKLIGIAPMLIVEKTAAIIGSPNVCDYVDFVVAPGKETAFCAALLRHLKQQGVGLLDLASLRPDSVAKRWMLKEAEERGYAVTCLEDDVSLERDLPATWEEYLQLLNTKQRHEVRRKLRRLEEAGSVRCRFIDDPEEVPSFLDTFVSLFAESRDDKAAFMTAEMETFFRSMAAAMSEAGLLRPSLMELDGVPVAALMVFDYGGTVYLYNSCFDPRYSSLSVGVLSKALCIKDSIERGRKRFDFLRGGEQYKYHLGGQEVPLYRCQIAL